MLAAAYIPFLYVENKVPLRFLWPLWTEKRGGGGGGGGFSRKALWVLPLCRSYNSTNSSLNIVSDKYINIIMRRARGLKPELQSLNLTSC